MEPFVGAPGVEPDLSVYKTPVLYRSTTLRYCGSGRGRTDTGVAAHGILSPACITSFITEPFYLLKKKISNF